MLFFFAMIQLSGQEKHFVFIQSDNQIPFSVMVNGKTLSSSALGYIIVPKLPAGTHNVTIGFAKNEYPEQHFSFMIQQKDLGFNLKNLGDKGWALFNLQTLDVTMAGSKPVKDVAKTEIASSDKEPIISFNRPKKDTLAVEKTGETAGILASTAKQLSVDTVEQSTTKEPVLGKGASNTSVQKISEKKEKDGTYLSYSDSTGKITDTIQVIIPTAAPLLAGNASKTNPETTTSAIPPASGINSPNSVSNSQTGDSTKNTVANTINQSATIKSNCKAVASEEDYNSLRKRMAKEAQDEKKIIEARKFYRNKCFTTSYVRNLSTLFPSDEGRYKFFEESYSYIVDVTEYPTLISEFIDPAFRNRFKAFVK